MLTLAFCSSCWAISDLDTSQDYRFTALEVPELEKIGTQGSIVEDRQGFTWFGGFNGLARFDGYNVVTFKHDPTDPNSLSYNGVTDLLSDSKGRLWVATYQGLNRYNESNGQFLRYMEGGHYPLPTSEICKIEEDLAGNIWVGTQNHGLLKIDGETAQHNPISINTPHGISLEGNLIRAMSLDREGQIWLGVQNLGLMVFNPETLELTYPKDNSGKTRNVTVNVISIAPDGNIWVGTSMNGLLRLDPETGTAEHFQHRAGDPNSLNHDSIWDIHFDDKGLLWIAADDALELYRPESGDFKHFVRLPGTGMYAKIRAMYQTRSGHFWLGMFPSGAAYLDIDATVFRNFVSMPNDPNSLVHTSVSAIAEDAKGNFWIGTEGGLDYLDTRTMTFKHYQHREGDPQSLPSDAVLSLLIDKTDTLWVGTWKGGWARFDAESETFIPAKMHDGTTAHMEEEVWDIYEDARGQLWVGGLYLYDRTNDVFRHYTDVYPQGDRLSSSRVNVMLEDSHGDFWLGTLAGINRLDRDTGKVIHYQSNALPHSLSDNILMSAMEDEEGNLWFGTHGGGVNIYNRAEDNFQHISAADGLYDDSITGIVDDQNGNIWMTSGGGLIHYEKDANKFELFDHKNGLKVDLFHRNAIVLSSDNQLVFGGANGLAILNPKELKKNTTVPPVVLTHFEVLNQAATPTSHPEILSKPINFTRNVTLNHEHNVFTLHYSALNYRMAGQNRYAYKLNGFDKDWIDVGHVRRATYTNLDPGEYEFQVKGSNNSGVWNTQGAKLKITILPPWWQTEVAYGAYAASFILFAYLIYFVLLKSKQARDERTLNKQLKEVAELKDTFLANTSHELRTPLNGIIGLAESMISSPENMTREEVQQKLGMVVNSGKRLSNIINDILDFSKLRNHDIRLNRSPVNLSELSRHVLTLSEPLVEGKSLQLINAVPEDFPLFLADEQRISQVLFNIVGNGIKFTTEGSIEISAETLGESIKINIKDTGDGICEDDFERIFLPFEQSQCSHDHQFIGTGLGLAVSKKLVELHHGKIHVSSSLNRGSTFTITLPFIQANDHETHSAARPYERDSANILPYHPTQASRKPKKRESKRYDHHILIVDDEPVNRMVLEGYLSLENYKTTECSSGQDALTWIENDDSIDMVLLDIMMPGLSGYEVCTQIRRHRRLLELPILFLTAKSQREDLTRGYQVGANDFLFKPVDKEELLAKIKMHYSTIEEYKIGKLFFR